jgi:hypothetical protein
MPILRKFALVEPAPSAAGETPGPTARRDATKTARPVLSQRASFVIAALL